MIDLTIGADHRGMELKDQVSKWLCPIDECMGDIVTFHDIGTVSYTHLRAHET